MKRQKKEEGEVVGAGSLEHNFGAGEKRPRLAWLGDRGLYWGSDPAVLSGMRSGEIISADRQAGRQTAGRQTGRQLVIYWSYLPEWLLGLLSCHLHLFLGSFIWGCPDLPAECRF